MLVFLSLCKYKAINLAHFFVSFLPPFCLFVFFLILDWRHVARNNMALDVAIQECHMDEFAYEAMHVSMDQA